MTCKTLRLFFTNLLKTAWKTEKVKSKVFQKSSIKLTFGLEDCCKSDFTRPISKTSCLKFPYPMNFAISKVSSLGQQSTFFNVEYCRKEVIAWCDSILGCDSAPSQICFVAYKSRLNYIGNQKYIQQNTHD